MERYRILTLVDITRSQAHRSETDPVKLGQQANFNSLKQAIELRSNIEWYEDPIMDTGRLPEPAQGRANYWIWEISSERDFVYATESDPVGLLKEDLHGVPIVAGLNESTDLSPAVIQTRGDNINTWVTLINLVL
jgi:hypothetical protein